MCKQLLKRFRSKSRKKSSDKYSWSAIIPFYKVIVKIEVQDKNYKLDLGDESLIRRLGFMLTSYVTLLTDKRITLPESEGKLLRAIMSDMITYKEVKKRWMWKFNNGYMTITEK